MSRFYPTSSALHVINIKDMLQKSVTHIDSLEAETENANGKSSPWHKLYKIFVIKRLILCIQLCQAEHLIISP